MCVVVVCVRACMDGWVVCVCAVVRCCVCVVTLGGVVLRWVSGSSTCTKVKK